MELSVATKVKLDRLFEESLAHVVKALGERADGRTGGMARIRYAVDPMLGLRGWHEVYRRRVGKREGDNWETVEDFSQEKVIRLMKRHFLLNEISSWQSRNPNAWEYDGAFIISADIPELGGQVFILVSFSGLPEHGDEAVGLLVVNQMDWASMNDCLPVIRASKNELASELLDQD